MFSLGSSFIGLMGFCSILTFVLQRKHLLMCLIALEGVILTLVLLYMSSGSQSEMFILFIMFTFGASEASLGLACLVYMMRSFGNDMFSVINNSKC